MASSPRVSTHIYKQAGNLGLTVDIHYPENFDKETASLLMHYHGGYLVFGEKVTFPAHWLMNACHQRGWAYATPSYRLIPEASGADVVQDAVDAARWVSENVAKSGLLVVAGSSAGGYLALATAAHPDAPPIAAVLSVYGMLDLLAPRYIQPGTPLKAAVENLPSTVDAIYKAAEQGPAIDGYPFPPDPNKDARFTWIKAIHEAAIYADLMTGIRGLAQKIAQDGTGVVPERYRFLFPATFGLHSKLPPMVLLHGDADTSVSVDLSKKLAKDLGDVGVQVHLEIVPGQDHGFDVRGVPDDVDIWSPGDTHGFLPSLARAVQFIEKFATCK